MTTDCKLSDLSVGDKVKIRHYCLYKDGYWQMPVFVDYEFLGKDKGEYHFKNLQYDHEHFKMKKEFEDSNVFLGRLNKQ